MSLSVILQSEPSQWRRTLLQVALTGCNLKASFAVKL